MTSAQKGGGPKMHQIIRQTFADKDGEGVRKSQNSVDIYYGSHLN